MKLFVANRGEVALRVIRAARAMGAETVAIHTPAEKNAKHTRLADHVVELPHDGAAAYLDVDSLVGIAMSAGATHLHPGWGFLSESPALASACSAAGIVFVGPAADHLELFGDKGMARDHALASKVPTPAATRGGISVDEAKAFLDEHPRGIMLKAVSGGGGRGMRAVLSEEELASSYRACQAEALSGFGRDDLYAEELMTRARHIEVQIVGDGERITVLGERDCTVQRRHQKLIEIAPSPALDDAQRTELAAHAAALFTDLSYRGLATVEFLVDVERLEAGELRALFIEVNPRLQVEHTVTEEVLGIDLVAAQLQIADGATLAQLDLPTTPSPRGYAIQCRVNAERMTPDGHPSASVGTIASLGLPSGPGVRVDTHAEVGLVIDGTFDSLLAKVIAHHPRDFPAAIALADLSLEDWSVEGVSSNAALLRTILRHPRFAAGDITTDFLDSIREDLREVQTVEAEALPGTVAAPSGGVVVAVRAAPGDIVRPGTELLVLEAMKMEQVVLSDQHGVITRVTVDVGDLVAEDSPVVHLEVLEGDDQPEDTDDAIDIDHVRPDLAELVARHELITDSARPEAVAKRHSRNHRTIRENIADLVEPNTFKEYGALTVAAQRGRRDVEELTRTTPADGLVAGIAKMTRPDGTNDSVAVIGYDYTVLAGTQGYFGHRKTDRLLDVAKHQRIPLILFAEGGGGRPGDTDLADIASSALDTRTFRALGELSGQTPTVGVLTGRCFAGNAALLGSCDVIIATADSTLGMAGPAMIEAAGLGAFTPEEVGPISVQEPNGVVDIVVPDDEAAVAAAQKYLSYFRGSASSWSNADQRLLRNSVPENRKRFYDIRGLIRDLADDDSVLELRRAFGRPAVTALIRIEGRPFGLIANDPAHLGGAIDAPAADKLARFLQLCDAHGLPVVSLCDTPGFMVGPQAEETATVRHFSRLFIIGAHLSVPMVTVILRKGYGLGAQAMAAGGFRETHATLAWPTGEVGGMGLEGGVRLGYAKELAAIDDPAQRRAKFEEMVEQSYERGKAINAAMVFELDGLIDPADTRAWIVDTMGGWEPDPHRVRRFVDAW